MIYKVVSFKKNAKNNEHKVVLAIKKRKWFKTMWEIGVFWGSNTVWREFKDMSFIRCNNFMEELLSDIEYEYLHFKDKKENE